MKKKKRKALRGIEQLGVVIGRVSDIAPPASASETRAPVSARDWEAAVGTRIAARAMPAKLDRGVLHVRVASSPWAQELSLLCEPILEKLRDRGIPVETLRFRVGRVEVPERSKTREEHVRTSPPAIELPVLLAKELENVRDEELRAAIRHAAEKNLGWQRMKDRPRFSEGTNDRQDEPRFGSKNAEGGPPQMSNHRVVTPKLDARDLRFVGPETDRRDRVVGPVSASPQRKRGLV